MRKFTAFGVLACSVHFGCGEVELTSGSATRHDSAGLAQGETPDAIPSEADTDDGSGDARVPEAEDTVTGMEEAPDVLIDKCLAGVEEHPFSEEELANPRLLYVQQKNHNNRVSARDAEVTETPQLTLVVVRSKNVNKGVIELLNPNGWYCVDLVAKNANKFRIKVACDATIVALRHTEHVAHDFAVERVGCEP